MHDSWHHTFHICVHAESDKHILIFHILLEKRIFNPSSVRDLYTLAIIHNNWKLKSDRVVSAGSVPPLRAGKSSSPEGLTLVASANDWSGKNSLVSDSMASSSHGATVSLCKSETGFGGFLNPHEKIFFLSRNTRWLSSHHGLSFFLPGQHESLISISIDVKFECKQMIGSKAG